MLAFASGATIMGTDLLAEGNESNATDANATPKLKQGMDAKVVIIGGGIKTLDQLIRNEADYIPAGVKWEKKAVEFMSEANTVKLASGKTPTYDYLVVAAGLQYNFEKIKDLTADMIGKNDIHSIYVPEVSPVMW